MSRAPKLTLALFIPPKGGATSLTPEPHRSKRRVGWASSSLKSALDPSRLKRCLRSQALNEAMVLLCVLVSDYAEASIGIFRPSSRIVWCSAILRNLPCDVVQRHSDRTGARRWHSAVSIFV